MQTVWSRVAQARCICNCPSCLSTTNALTRRATTATARRIVRVGDVFTASLASLAAGLAFADSKKKDDRFRQWDKVIAGARATVEATEIQQRDRLAALMEKTQMVEHDVSAEQAVEDVEAWDTQESEEPDQSPPMPDNRTDTWLYILNRAREQYEMRKASGFQQWKGLPLGLLRNLSKTQLNELLSHERHLRRLYGGPDCDSLDDECPTTEKRLDPTTSKRLRILVWSVAKMGLNQTDTWLDVFNWAREQHKMREASGFQGWKGPPLSLLQNLSRADLTEFLSRKRHLGRFYGGPDCDSLVDEQSKHVLSMKKIRILECSVLKMVLRLLMLCEKKAPQPDESPSFSASPLLRELLKGEDVEARIEYNRACLRVLHAGRRHPIYYQEFESPPIPNYDCTAVEEYEQTNEMNQSLRRLLESMKHDMDLSDLMSKICYNLLTARTPPNTHTYNMLLVRFCVLEREDLVRTVLKSMRDAHIRPNEVTHATLLRHFTATGNRYEFLKYWMRMEGYEGGLALANPEHSTPWFVEERYRVFGRRYRKAAEKARMNGEVYESLIVGAMKFFGGQTAMHYYRNMISEGWTPSLGIALAILQDCCHRLDWTVGSAVLEQLEKTAEKINTLAYEWMLRLCQVCGQQEVFDQILLNGVRRDTLPAALMDLSDYAKPKDIIFLIESAKELQLRKAVGKPKELKKTATTLGHAVGDGGPSLENVFRDREDKDTRCHTVNQTNDVFKARLALQSRLHDISNKINHTALEVHRTLYMSQHLPSVKFWLSERVKHLEQELEQQANGVSHPAHSSAVEHDTIQSIEASRAEDGLDKNGKLTALPMIAGSSDQEAVYLLDQPPRDTNNSKWSNGNKPSLLPMTHSTAHPV